MNNFAFYVSGHGYGHAARTTEVIRCLLERLPRAVVHVRMSAPEWVFRVPAGADVRFERVALDAGVAEGPDPLHIDPAATLELVRAFERGRDRLVADEVAFVRRARIDLLVADIPYMAGDVAAAAGVPCLGISNFTWDYVYHPHLVERPDGAALLDRIRAGYAKMHAYLKLPFGHPVGAIDRVVEVPLVARQRTADPVVVARQLPVAPDDPRPRVLLGMRGALVPQMLTAAARGGPDFLFLYHGDRPTDCPENLCPLSPTQGPSFTDLPSVCAVVVSKLGYGIVSDAVVNRTALLYPPRSGFREDELLRAGADRYLRAGPIPLADFRSGNWAPFLRDLLQMPEPAERPATDGARVCADLIAGFPAGL